MVEGARLEIVWAGDRLGGSNPLASAMALMSLFCTDSDLRCESSRFRQALGLFFVGFFLEGFKEIAVSAKTIFASNRVFKNRSPDRL